MRIGIGLWCLQSTATAPRSFTAAYGELLDDARLAERVGIDSLWLSEHHGYHDGYCPALLPAAAAALSVTDRLRVGTGVLLLPLHEADRVRTAATELAVRSGDRFELGMGMGYRPGEFEARGLELGERVRLMTAGLDDLAVDAPCPLWVGVTSAAAARRAGRRGLGLLISGAFSPEVVRTLVAAHRQAWEDAGCPPEPCPLGAGEAEPGRVADASSTATGSCPPLVGGPPGVGVLRNVWLADSEAERRRALDWVRSSYLVYAGLGWGADATGVDFVAQIEASMDEVEASAIVGGADEVADRLAQYEADLVVCRIGYDQPPRSALTEVIERIGTELVPRLAGAREPGR
jgi:alkanesulfonate monooxygenase SsuD/methylene tetrahydromethanopterin reductase-like flavin-dependent oxidoreductase (luciferase family)